MIYRHIVQYLNLGNVVLKDVKNHVQRYELQLHILFQELFAIVVPVWFQFFTQILAKDSLINGMIVYLHC